jgi:F-type H+-transporting ATPase subunit delta
MKGSAAARRYAKALMSLSLEKGNLDTIYSDMILIKKTIVENKELRNVLQSPIVKMDSKQSILKAIFTGKVDAMTEGFIDLVAEKGREGKLLLISTAFIDAYKEHKNIAKVEVTSAVALDEGQKKKIIEMIATQGISNVDMEEKIDPALIGGFIVRFGDQQIDASIVRKFNNLKQELVSN